MFFQKSTLLICGKNGQNLIPRRATPGSVGYDLFSPEKFEVPAHTRISIDLGIQIQFTDKHTFGLIKERSGLAKEYGLIILGGVIDNDFRGNITVMLHNLGNSKVIIEKEMKIAQLLCLKFETPDIEQCERLTQTSRGSRGFGSTGLF